MFESLLTTVRSTYSGASAKNYIAAISRFHRIQASDGMRGAIGYCKSAVEEMGLEPEVLSFPARYDAASWTYPHHEEWECRSATLDLIEPAGDARRLADFNINPISVIQRSAAFEGDLEIVLLEDGSKPEDYEAIDVKGKLVLISKPVEAVRELAIEKNGAAGLLTDVMSQSDTRPYLDLADAVQYTSFWWRGSETQTFGFVLSPRQGLWLRELIRKESDEGRHVRVRAKVDARLFPGEFESVTALLRGETDEEVVMVGHICHPAPGANDNASGAAATMEAARALQVLVSEGKLPRPRRSIRFLWPPEILGSYAFLASHEDRIEKMIAGINMDMVGEDQELCRSSFLVDLPPEGVASFAGDLIVGIRDAAVKEVSSYANTTMYPLFRYATGPFGGGSDHMIFNDPTVAVPMPMLIQWPDRFYHTSADSLDKVDPKMLGVIGSIATTYAYWIATAGESEATRMGEVMMVNAKQRVVRAALEAGTQNGVSRERAVRYRVGREQAAFDSLARLAPRLDVGVWRSEIEEFGKRELDRLIPNGTHGSEHADSEHKEPSDEVRARAINVVPVRRKRGPMNMGPAMNKLSETEREELKTMTSGDTGRLQRLAPYWADGTRTLYEISELAAMESGRTDLEFVVKYFEFLEKLELLDLKPARLS